jgi:adenylylsulfate kinase-like enzyme
MAVLADTVMIYLVGLAGTGKYTIAKAIATQYDYKVVDNHLLSNPLYSLLPKGGAKNPPEGTSDKIQRIRNVVFEFMREDLKSNYVLTNQLLENKYHHEIYQQVLTLASKRKSLFIPVTLTVSKEERAKRIVQADRAARFKITDVQETYKPPRAIKLQHPNLFTLDVSDLTPSEAAKKIMDHIDASRMAKKTNINVQ